MKSKMKNASNFFWAIVDRGAMLFFQFFALIYLSHLVTPYEFGLIAILNIFINLSNVAIDSGMLGAVIKKQNIKDIDYYTLFVYNFVFAILIYIFLFLIAPLVADFYNDTIIIELIRTLSLSIIFTSLGLVQLAKLTKSLNFKGLAIVTILSQLISVLFSIYLAEKGFGVWALVSLQLVHVILNTFFLMIINKFLPKFKFSLDSFKEQFHFGAPLLISNIVYIVNVNVYSSLIGKYISTRSSGYFYQAYKLQNTPTGILSAVVDKVGFTLLSKIKENKDVIKSAHEMYKVIYLLVIPVFVYVYIISEELFLFVFKDKWKVAAPIFKILCLSIIPLTIKVLNRNIFKSVGATKLILKLEIFNTLCVILMLVFTLSQGLVFVSYGILITNLLLVFLSMYFLYKKLSYSFSKQLGIILPPLIKAILIFVVLNYIFTTSFNNIGYLNELFSLALYFIIYFIFNYNTLKSVLYEKS